MDNSALVDDIVSIEKRIRDLRNKQLGVIKRAYWNIKPKDAVKAIKSLWFEVQLVEAIRYKFLKDNFSYDIDEWEFDSNDAELLFRDDRAFNFAVLNHAYAVCAKRAVKKKLKAASSEGVAVSPVKLIRECMEAIGEAWELFTGRFCFLLVENAEKHGVVLPQHHRETAYKVLTAWVGSRFPNGLSTTTWEEMPGEVASHIDIVQEHEDIDLLRGKVEYALFRKPRKQRAREISESDYISMTMTETSDGVTLDSVATSLGGIDEFEAKQMLACSGLTKKQMETICYRVSGHEYEEIAVMMGVDTGTVKTQLSRAKNQIEHCAGRSLRKKTKE
jgi:DNA-binding CsgD family transcriptional regulator